MNFRNKDYTFTDFSSETILKKTEPLFPSYKRISNTYNGYSSKSIVKFFTPSEHNGLLTDDKLEWHLSFFVDMESDEFNIDNVVNEIKLLLIAFSGYTQGCEYIFVGQSGFYLDEYIKLHLDVTLSKINELELRNKIIGILMWDSVKYEGHSIKDVIYRFMPMISKSENLNKIADKRKEKCKKCGSCKTRDNCNTGCPYVDTCERTVRDIYNVAMQSILNGKITTSKKRN